MQPVWQRPLATNIVCQLRDVSAEEYAFQRYGAGMDRPKRTDGDNADRAQRDRARAEGEQMKHEIPVGRPLEVLLVEDDLEDAGLTIETLREGGLPCRVSLVRDGDEALAFLRREAHFARVPRPDVVLLDMQMPKKDGRAVLAEMRCDEKLR